jgi:uncharacterized protein YggE
MNQMIKSALLAVAAVLLGTILYASGPTQVSAQEDDADSQRRLSVSATGQVQVVPDVVVVQLGVETQAEEASAALAQNNEQMQALIDALTASGVTTDSIQTQAVQLTPIFQTPVPEPLPEGEQQAPSDAQADLIGYRASNLVQVRMPGVGGVGELIDSAIQAGGNRIDGIWFEVSEPEAWLDQARENAWAEAERKAQQLAELAGVELGELLSISETSFSPLPITAPMSAAEMGVPIQPGTQTLQADIHVTWLMTGGAE